MKTINVLIFIALAASTTSAFARLGETRKEIDQRYGQGARSDIQRLEGAETIKYHFNNFEVEVVFHNDKSIWEIFHQGNIISTKDARMLMKANAGGGLVWHYDGVNHGWQRSGGLKLIGYHWPGHEDYFCIEDVKAVEDIKNSDVSDLGGF